VSSDIKKAIEKELPNFYKETGICPTTEEEKIIVLAMITGALIATDSLNNEIKDK